MDTDSPKPDLVGLKQVLRAAQADELAAVYLADDAEEHIRSKVNEVCGAHHIAVSRAASMETLGQICGIDVGAAAAGVKKAEPLPHE